MKIGKALLALFVVGLLFLCGCDYTLAPFPEIASTYSETAADAISSESHALETSEEPRGTGTLTVHFIDVGQGDSAFIELPNGETMLIDAGEASEGDNVVTYILSQGYDTVDYVVASHPHDDHIGGMSEVLNHFIVKNFYLTGAVGNSDGYEEMMTALAENAIPTNYAAAGNIIIDEDKLLVEAVAPKTLDCDNLNDTSIVLKLTYNENVFLFTGDAEKKEEDGIWTNIKCDVLKVGHHGSSTSTSENFLKKTEPTYAVISAGLFNSYGHPTEKTLGALAERGIKTYRTDLQGTITFTSDGKDITVNKDPVENEAPTVPESAGYVLNTKSKKIHYPYCESVKTIKEKNKEYTDDFGAALAEGYTPCGSCKPTADNVG